MQTKIPFNSIFWLLILVILSHSGRAQVTIGSTEVDTQSVATNLDTPWEIVWGPDDHIWFTEREGRVSRLNPETGDRQVLLTIDEVHEQGESGLLGMALHPNFEQTPWVYLVYNYLSGSSIQERLVRYTFLQESLKSPRVLFDGIEGSSIHNGSRIVIDSLNRLYFTTGDASEASIAQDLNSVNGKILRMNLDGSLPDDNPYQDSYVWTYGHRNPQGLVFSPGGILYSSEHGPASDDEVNIIEKGRNYGWPDVMGYCDEAAETDFCSQNNVKEPIAAWTPTLAVAGIDFYNHEAIPEWNNSILMTTLKESELVQLKLSEDGQEVVEENRWFDEWWGRLRDVCIADDGRVFIAVSNRDGRGDPAPGDDRIVEISPATAISSGPAIDKNAFRIFPNPAQRITRLSIPEHFVGGTLHVFDSEGKEHLARAIRQAEEILQTGHLPTGVYIIRIQKDKQKLTRKMILK
jgi:glucose/arabinose dehydrogenase